MDKRRDISFDDCMHEMHLNPPKNDLNAFMDIRLENSCTKGKRETIMKEIDKYEFTCI